MLVPSQIGKPNKFEIPAAYFEAGSEPLLDEYKSFSTSWTRHPPMRKNPIRHSRMSSIWEWRLREPRASMRRMPKPQAASALGIFFAETNGIKTPAMRARTHTREVCKRAHPKIKSGTKEVGGDKEVGGGL